MAKTTATKKKRSAEDEVTHRKHLQRAGLNDDQVRQVCRLMAAFARDLPEAAASGQYDPTQDPAFVSERLDVPDGNYRVVGSDWIVTVKGRKAVQFGRAAPSVDPASYVEVPNDD